MSARWKWTWLTLLVGFTLARGIVLAFLVPPWQAPDEPGHYEYTRLVLAHGPGVQPDDRDVFLQRAIIADLARSDFWANVRALTPDPLPTAFYTDPFLARSGSQVKDEPIAYYWLLSLLWRVWPKASIREQLLIGRLFSTILLALTVLLTAWAAMAGWPADRKLHFALPAFVALQPMAAFMGAALNNDALALLLGTLGSTIGIWVVRRGLSWWRVAIVVGVVVAGLQTKKTNLFLWPLAFEAMLLALPPTVWSSHWWRRQISLPRFRYGVVIVGLVLVGFAAWLAGPINDRPAAWVAGGWSGEDSRWVTARTTGLALFDLDPNQRALLEQTIGRRRAWDVRGRPLMLQAQVRSLDGPTEVSVRADDNVIATEASCLAERAWHPCTLSFTPGAEPGPIRIVLAVGAKGHTAVTGAVQWRSVQLVPVDGQGTNLLVNSSGKRPARRATPLFLWSERLLQAPRGWLLALAQPEHWEMGAMLRYAIFGVLAFASFWGNFGWLQAPLPWPFYVLVAVLCGLAIVGMIGELARALAGKYALPNDYQARVADWLGAEGPVILCVGAVLLILVQTTLPMLGFAWQPQGRYMLPALLPIGVCLIMGLRNGLPRQWRKHAEFILLTLLAVANVAMFWVLSTRW